MRKLTSKNNRRYSIRNNSIRATGKDILKDSKVNDELGEIIFKSDSIEEIKQVYEDLLTSPSLGGSALTEGCYIKVYEQGKEIPNPLEYEEGKINLED